MSVMKVRLLAVTVFVTLLLIVLAAAALAQEEIEMPPLYTGLENPFSWDDVSAQEAGKVIFQKFCAVCHIATEDVPVSLGPDFSAVDYRQNLEEGADFYFWTVSEGRLLNGMPPWEDSLSEEERWQALTYIWSLGGAEPSAPPPSIEEGTLQLMVPKQAQSGQSLAMTATLQDKEGEPVLGATVQLFIQMDFFASNLMKIGEAVTDEQGMAVLEYTPRQMGDIQVIAQYKRNNLTPIEATTMTTLAEPDGPFYHVEAGLQSFGALGEEVFIGPPSALELVDGAAPASAFRLPSGVLSWILILVATVALIWVTYFRVVYQVFRIPIVSEMGDTDTRTVPIIILAAVVALGFLLVTMILTGPYNHLHLF
ncbi:MAG: c-type cytochrome [Dehalococcoidales bacterium]|jgi:mono/diheme cytochrome c family protein|nr:c-type cytochrome [Dehalococcoidales bacterium]